MNYSFEEINSRTIEQCFNPFYGSKSDLYFEIWKESVDAALYRIKKLTDKVCEISLFVYEHYRRLTTKGFTIEVITFPFSLGYEKVLISTEIEKMAKMLNKMSKYGVNQLKCKNDKLYWFEVTK